MENKLENKERFFAMYWGQKVMKKNIDGLENFITEPDGFIRSISNEVFLVLKPLSAISDEDASSLRGFINKGDFLFYLRKCKNQYDFIDSNLSLENLDYLRSRGYALPWMGLSVEELVNRGWVKLKGETK